MTDLPTSPATTSGLMKPKDLFLVGDNLDKLTAAEVVRAYERGELHDDTPLRIQKAAPARPLRKYIRELVWTEYQSLSETLEPLEESFVYKTAFENAPVGLVITDLAGRITRVNKAWCDLLGYSESEVLMMRVGEFSAGEDRSEELRLGNSLMSGDLSSFQIEKTYSHKEGRTITALLSVAMVRDADGLPASVIGQVVDLTENVALERELAQTKRLHDTNLRLELTRQVAERTAELNDANLDLEEKNEALAISIELAAQASRSKDEFLAGMSHELRTPLNVILNMSESLQEGIYGVMGEKQARPVRMVEESGRHLLSLINDILDLARVGAGTMKLSMQTVIVEDVCRASIRLIQPSALNKRLTVTTSFAPDVTFVRADKRRLKQILLNLLSNAVKFTPAGGAVGLEVTRGPGNNAILFSVWDTGAGISKEEQQRLFKPFIQLDPGLNRKHDGTGLGLSLVAQMTELHGGSVRLESRGHGHGSRFTISLPGSEATIQRSGDTPDP